MDTIISNIVSAIASLLLTYLLTAINKILKKKEIYEDSIRKKSALSTYLSTLTYHHLIFLLIIIAVDMIFSVLIFGTKFSISNYYFRTFYSIFLVLGQFALIFDRKVRRIISDITKSFVSHKIKNCLIFFLPNVFIILYFLLPIIIYQYTDYIFGVLLICYLACFIYSLRYFSFIKKYKRYDKVKVYFNNSTPSDDYNIEDVIEEKDFICLSKKDCNNQVSCIKYNKSIIAMLEYIPKDIDELYHLDLLKLGIKEHINPEIIKIKA